MIFRGTKKKKNYMPLALNFSKILKVIAEIRREKSDIIIMSLF